MRKGVNSENLLKRYLRWPLWVVIFLLAATVCVYITDRRAGNVLAIFSLAAIIITLLYFFSIKKNITKALVGFAMSMDENGNRMVSELDVPLAITDTAGKISWRNAAFAEAFSEEVNSVYELFSDITEDVIYGARDREELHSTYRDRKYNIVIKRSVIDGTQQYYIYFYDETAFVNLSIKYADDTPVTGLIYLDNYDEVIEKTEEGKKSLLLALIDRKIARFVDDNDGFYMKPEKDRYVFIIKKMYLEQIEAGKFDILEDVKTVNTGSDLHITLSIGVAVGSKAYSENYDVARQAMDMALARGGDQAVIKEGESIRYYGGKSQSIEKATRVKSRVKANAFEELLKTKDKLIIMGHTMMDIDSFGAAAGLWRIATDQGKKAYIILGEHSALIEPILERFRNAEYPDNMFIDKAKAMDYADETTALVIVDVNRPQLVEAPELLDIIDTVIVFDHHRQSSDVIEPAVLSYIEPYASSASEMVTEMAQYISGSVRLKPQEADAMYAGIVIDTNNFTIQTGVRTFEAAAFLKKNGADVVRVRKLFRDEESDYRAKAEAISNAEILEDSFAISVCNTQGVKSPTVVGAQAANELLNMSGIKASIVLSEFNGKVYVSARSIDEVNVQLMMEKLGGGGHRSIAGAQLEGVSIEEALNIVRELITDMLEKGELSR